MATIIGAPDVVGTITPGNKALTAADVIYFLGAGTALPYNAMGDCMFY